MSGNMGGTASEQDQLSLIAMRAELFAWYRSHPNKQKLTQVHDLSLSMLGSRDHYELKLKAMETRCFSFCAPSFEKNMGQLWNTSNV